MNDDSSEESKISALLHCYFREDPDSWDEDTFWKNWGRLKYFMQKTGKWEKD